MGSDNYIHGTSASEQQRLTALNQATNARFIQFLNPSGAKRILEVGSGLGILARAVAEAAPNASVVGVEYSVEQLSHAPRGVPNLELEQGDAHALRFEQASFDLVYARYLLEHLGDCVLALKEMRRVLSPGGRLMIQENDISCTRLDPPAPAFNLVWRAFAEQQARLGGDAHMGTKLYGVLVDAGFQEISLSTDPEVHWFGSPGFDSWMANLQKLLAGAGEQLVCGKLASSELLAAASGELVRLRKDRRASAIFHWNRAAAVKEGP